MHEQRLMRKMNTDAHVLDPPQNSRRLPMKLTMLGSVICECAQERLKCGETYKEHERNSGNCVSATLHRILNRLVPRRSVKKTNTHCQVQKQKHHPLADAHCPRFAHAQLTLTTQHLHDLVTFQSAGFRFLVEPPHLYPLQNDLHGSGATANFVSLAPDQYIAKPISVCQ